MSNSPIISSIVRHNIFLSGREKPFFLSNSILFCQLYTNYTFFDTERKFGIASTNSNSSVSTIKFFIHTNNTKGTYSIVVLTSTVLLLGCIHTNSHTNLQTVPIHTESYNTATYKTVSIRFTKILKNNSFLNHFSNFGKPKQKGCQWSNVLKR